MSTETTDVKSRPSGWVITGIAATCISAGGALGAVIGNTLGSAANGFRVGVILGGTGAFMILQRKRRRQPPH